MRTPQGGADPRLLLGGGIALLLAGLVTGVVLLSGGSDRSFEPAPQACVESWNGDPAAVRLGRHQSGAHGYAQIQVLYLHPSGSAAGSGKRLCAVVFAAQALDPEPEAAAQVQRPAGWRPLSEVVEEERLAELQADAQRSYNATLSEEGTIEPL